MTRITSSTVALLLFAFIGLSSWTSAQTPDFEKHILPILKSRCFECHSAPYKDKRGRMKFPKAGLRLDGKDHILAGETVVPKSPQSSLMVEYISLPAGDADIMPPKGRPLSTEDIQTIYNWVNDGAPFGAWTGAARKAVKKTAAPKVASVPSRIKLLKELGKDVKPLDASALKEILPGKARIRASYPGSGLLDVSFSRSASTFTSEDLKALKPIASRIARLDLGGTAVTDKDLTFLAGMERLMHLDLHKTKVTDKGMASIQGLKELRYLNLYGTEIGDNGLPNLTLLKRLESLFLWKTKVSPDGLKRLAQMLPKAKISYKLVLPDPAADPAPRNRRRGQ
ncbi:MAG: hypothetical protein ACI97A_000549 [Planctomycetota bacterium]|jgi:hypothetical protein